MELNELWQQLNTLPPEAQREVAIFISSLRQRYQRSQPTSQTNQQNWREDSFVGLWQERQDLQDSTQWVRSTRQQEWPS